MKRFLIMCFIFAACAMSALSQDARCELPLSHSGTQVAKVPSDLAEQLLKKAFNLMDATAEERAKILQDAKSSTGVSGLFCAQTVRLARTGTPQLFIYFPSFCTSQNCPVWVYSHNRSRYELLLEDTMVGEYNPGSGSGAVILAASTNGHQDIRLETLVTAFESGITIFKFDGKRYQARVCMTMKCRNGTKGCKYTRRKCDLPDIKLLL